MSLGTRFRTGLVALSALAAAIGIWVIATEEFGLIGLVLGVWAASIAAWLIGFGVFKAWNLISARLQRQTARPTHASEQIAAPATQQNSVPG